jgi:hypothetical protein
MSEALPVLKAEKLNAPKIDGKPDEWNGKYAITINKAENVIYGKDKWKGEGDLSMKAYLGYDENNLYIYVDVTDNKYLYWDSASDMWKGDHLEIWLHAPSSEKVLQLGFQPGDFDSEKASAYIWHPKKLADDARKLLIDKIEVSGSKTESGYAIEAKIPKAVFGGNLSLDKGLELDFALSAGDTDEKGEPHKALMSTSPVLSKNRPLTFGKLIPNCNQIGIILE